MTALTFADWQQRARDLHIEGRAFIQGEYSASAAGADFEARKAVFEARAQAQRAAFEARIEELNRSAANATGEARAAIEKRVSALNDDLHRGRNQLDRLGEATDAAWTQFVEGLRDARAAFRETYERD